LLIIDLDEWLRDSFGKLRMPELLEHLEAVRRTDRKADLKKCIVDPDYLQWYDLQSLHSQQPPRKAGIFIFRMKLNDSVQQYRSKNCRSPEQHLTREIADIHHTGNLWKLITDLEHNTYYFKAGWPTPSLDAIGRNNLVRKVFEDNFRGRLDVAWLDQDRAESLGKVLHAAYIMIHGHALPMDIIVNKYIHQTPDYISK